MQLEVGAILEGKVTGITKFGAFVALPEGKSGLVHISEIANTYVSEVRDYVQDGQTVKVKIIGISPDGKINLSMKKAEERPQRPAQDERAAAPRRPRAEERTADLSFEDKLKQFMQESDSRMSGNKLYDRRSNNRRRRD